MEFFHNNIEASIFFWKLLFFFGSFYITMEASVHPNFYETINDSLLIFKVDIYGIGILIPVIEYEIYKY
jgi:hypothetical protein